MKYSLEKILTLILIGIGSLILLFTLIFFAAGIAKPGKNLRNRDIQPEQLEKKSEKTSKPYDTFTGIGRIRCVTKDGKTVVLTPWFSYTAGDQEFFEELSRKSNAIKGIILSYTADKTEKELKRLGETSVKAQLLDSINKSLVLNKIQGLYFMDYIFLE